MVNIYNCQNQLNKEMKVLIDSYNSVMQHEGGGVQMRIGKFLNYYSNNRDVQQAKLFNKWEDKLKDYDILHEFKAHFELFPILSLAKEQGLKTVLSSVVPQEHSRRIQLALIANKVIPFNNTYSLIHSELDIVDAIIAQTNKEATFISQWYKIPRTKIHVIPNGVNESILQGYSSNNKKDIVLCVGRFDHNKNQKALIEAAKDTPYEVHFIGGQAIDDAAYYEECKALAKGNSNIIFHGWLKDSSLEFIELYKRARVVALVSHHEIFGNSLIEGAACGANLLSTDELPTHEWGFGDHCVSVKVSDVHAIRNALEKVYEMPLDSSLHDIVESRFSWQSIANQHIKLYQELLA